MVRRIKRQRWGQWKADFMAPLLAEPDDFTQMMLETDEKTWRHVRAARLRHLKLIRLKRKPRGKAGLAPLHTAYSAKSRTNR